MNRVTPCRRPRSRRAAVSSGGNAIGRPAPRKVWTGGRGRSAGSSRTVRAPRSASFQRPICESRTPAVSQSRCQTAKSAYWIGSSGSAAASPVEAAVAAPASSRDQDPDRPAVGDDVVHGQRTPPTSRVPAAPGRRGAAVRASRSKGRAASGRSRRPVSISWTSAGRPDRSADRQRGRQAPARSPARARRRRR